MKTLTLKSKTALWELGLGALRELETEAGILASGRSEAYGCIFGRDSLITALSLLRLHERKKDEYFLALTGKILSNLSRLQGSAVNIESGEEPGKIIHEFRPDRHEHLTASAERWYVHPDGTMRNYDSVDATPLYLMAMHAYLRESNEEQFIHEHLPHIRAALSWILLYADSNGDGFLDYRFREDRTHGGLKVQSWMDSTESVFSFVGRNGTGPRYPIAPVEVQGYAYAALRMWADFFATLPNEREFTEVLTTCAQGLKEKFNRSFVLARGNKLSLAFALDGTGRPLAGARSSMGHVLWAAVRSTDGFDSILDAAYISALVSRLLSADLYTPRAGMRTLSTRSRHFDPQSYHNGSIWPHDTAMLAEGLENFGYAQEAARLRRSLLRAYRHFAAPVELFTYYKRGLQHYESPSGQRACQTQAWSAASLLSTLQGLEEKI